MMAVVIESRKRKRDAGALVLHMGLWRKGLGWDSKNKKFERMAQLV
jgi:hypothetical protein